MAWLTFRERISAFSPVLKVNFGAFAAISFTPSYLLMGSLSKMMTMADDPIRSPFS
jgi:hypothetical protein